MGFGILILPAFLCIGYEFLNEISNCLRMDIEVMICSATSEFF